MGASSESNMRPYVKLGVMTLLSFLAMYVLMYSMVNSFSNVFMSLNQVYMAALMASPMVLIELLLMRHMYPDARRNTLIAAGALGMGVVAFVFIREQTATGDRQFLRSMIPHHAGAILMCQNASLSRDEIKRLCQEIITSQEAEIAQMKTLLNQQDK